ncbi:MAG: Holliday junction branch migration DNA helicase RuvB [Synergistetes bacterium]|nr:Holliday junction branch migration DNA helicase RuvB [Synergistota bacterium]
MNSFRPSSLGEFVGQKDVTSRIRLFVDAALRREEPLDHMILSGPAGLGKTTLARIVANELGVGFTAVGATAIERAADLVSLLAALNYRDVLFIDEIHRLRKPIEEILYLAMEDWVVDIPTGKGALAKVVRIQLQPFTLIGATTRVGMLSAPLRSRFGIVFSLDFYPVNELAEIVMGTAKVIGVEITPRGALTIARSSRGTPRLANRLLRRVRDFAQVHEKGIIDETVVSEALAFLNIDENGLDRVDYAFLRTIVERFGGGPVGISAIASSLGEDRNTLEDVYEPYLMKLGLVVRTPRGRVATRKAFEILSQKEGIFNGA